MKRRNRAHRSSSLPRSAQSLWRSSPLINTTLHLCSCSERRSFTAPCCVNYQVFPMSPFPCVLHSLPHLNFLTRLEQIRSHTGSRHAGRKWHAIWSEPNLCVRARERWGRAVIYRTGEVSLSSLISLMQQGAAAPAVTGGPRAAQSARLQSPYFTLLSHLTNMRLCLSSATRLSPNSF